MNAWSRYLVVVIGVLAFVWSGMTLAGWKNPDLLIDAKVLNDQIKNKDVVVVDCRDLKDYIKGHIPGAISLGKRCKKALRDTTARVFRDVEKYNRLFSKAGISNDDTIIYYYDGMKTLTDATVGFWVSELMGHKKVKVLNGGLEAWRKAGYRLDSKPVVRKETKYVAKFQPNLYAETSEILQIAKGEASSSQLIDSRTAKENKGDDIRAIRGGTVPNTKLNKSHIDTLASAKDPKTGKMKPVALFDYEAANKAFGSLDKKNRTIAFCQTGTRSTMTYLQLRMLGFENVANWDESWRVYGSNVAYPVEGEQWFNFASLNKKMKSLEKKVEELSAASAKK